MTYMNTWAYFKTHHVFGMLNFYQEMARKRPPPKKNGRIFSLSTPLSTKSIFITKLYLAR